MALGAPIAWHHIWSWLYVFIKCRLMGWCRAGLCPQCRPPRLPPPVAQVVPAASSATSAACLPGGCRQMRRPVHPRATQQLTGMQRPPLYCLGSPIPSAWVPRPQACLLGLTALRHCLPAIHITAESSSASLAVRMGGGRLLKEVHPWARDAILDGVHLLMRLLGPAFVSTGIQGPLLDKACPLSLSCHNS